VLDFLNETSSNIGIKQEDSIPITKKQRPWRHYSPLPPRYNAKYRNGKKVVQCIQCDMEFSGIRGIKRHWYWMKKTGKSTCWQYSDDRDAVLQF
jgi:hypothetical protein